MCERVIDHGLDTMKLCVNYTFDRDQQWEARYAKMDMPRSAG